MQKWFEVAERNIEPEDRVMYRWTGRYDENSGYIILSKKEILVVEERGFIRKTADLLPCCAKAS